MPGTTSTSGRSRTVEPGHVAPRARAPATAQIPVVFLTAKAMTSEVQRLMNLGAQGVLTKPFDPMALPDQLKACLPGR